MLKWLTKEPPKIGSKWALKGEEGNPFTDDYTVIVEEIRAEWVKYRWNWAVSKDKFYGSYLSIRSFRACYRELG